MDNNEKVYKDKFENIEVPLEVDLVIEKAIKRGKNRFRNNFIKITGTLTACLLLVMYLDINSPTFAEYINTASTKVENVFSYFRDRGIDNAVKNGYVQENNTKSQGFSKSVSDKGITVTIDQFAISENELLLGYTIKADSTYNDWDDLTYYSFQITDNKGIMLRDHRNPNEIAKEAAKENKNIMNYQVYDELSYNDVNKESFKKLRMKQGIFEFRTDKIKMAQIPDSITIKFQSFTDQQNAYIYNKMNVIDKITHKAPKIVNGNWTINIKVDDKLKNAKVIQYEKAEIIAENSNINIDYVNLYPTSANAKFNIPFDMQINKMYLEDENGNMYSNRDGRTRDINIAGIKKIEETPNFESPYFNNINKLYLIIEGKQNNKDKHYKIELKKK